MEIKVCSGGICGSVFDASHSETGVSFYRFFLNQLAVCLTDLAREGMTAIRNVCSIGPVT